MKPLLAIELDDASHQRPDRQDRDTFVNDVFAAANFPILHVPARASYSTREIAAQLAPYLNPTSGAPSDGTETPSPSPAPTTSSPPNQPQIFPATAPISTPALRPDDGLISPPNCPKCGLPMILRTVSRGPHIGEPFYGCRNFPRCRETRPAHE